MPKTMHDDGTVVCPHHDVALETPWVGPAYCPMPDCDYIEDE